MSEGTSTRGDQVVQAAIGVFLRYGYARTTMADIAQAAGLSRPTLYLEFPDKDAIFHAVVDAMVSGDKKFNDAVGEEQLQTLMKGLDAAVESSESDLFAFDAQLSYVPDSWISSSPDFWAKK